MTTAPDDRQPNLTTLAAAVEEADDALVCLQALTALSEAASARRAEAVQQAREQHASWDKVGTALGVSKQSAQARYGIKRPTTAEDDDPDERAAPKPGSEPARVTSGRAGVEYALTTPGGRTLLRFVPRRQPRQ